jgi:hypothetical protein
MGGKGGVINRKIFILQKRAIRLMAGVNSRSSCRQLFKKTYDLDSIFIIYTGSDLLYKKALSRFGAQYKCP